MTKPLTHFAVIPTLYLKETAMNIKNLLLNGKAFLTLLKDFAIDSEHIRIQEEEKLALEVQNARKDILVENVCIEARSADSLFNFFGVLHLNLLNNKAVFEMQGYEKVELYS